MQRDELLRVVEASWQALDGAVADLATEDLIAPGVVGDWSVIAVLGHVSAWEQQALRLIDQWERGEPLDDVSGPAVDAYNASEAERRRGWAPEAVLAEQVETRRRLHTAIGGLSDTVWKEVRPIGDRPRSLGELVAGALGGDGPGDHAAEHARQIRAWRAR